MHVNMPKDFFRLDSKRMMREQSKVNIGIEVTPTLSGFTASQVGQMWQFVDLMNSKKKFDPITGCRKWQIWKMEGRRWLVATVCTTQVWVCAVPPRKMPFYPTVFAINWVSADLQRPVGCLSKGIFRLQFTPLVLAMIVTDNEKSFYLRSFRLMGRGETEEDEWETLLHVQGFGKRYGL